MVAPTSHDSSRADPTRRAVMRIPTLVQRVFGSVTVWRDHSFTSLVWAHAKRTAHGEVRSPCAVRSARHDEKRGELGLCQTSRRARARNPGVRTRKKGYASHQLTAHTITKAQGSKLKQRKQMFQTSRKTTYNLEYNTPQKSYFFHPSWQR